jgi:hypothetical protein
MNIVKCPRCEQVWVSPDEAAGSVQLCPGCRMRLDALAGAAKEARRKKRRRKKPRRSLVVNPFAIVVAAFTLLDLALIVLSRLEPDPFRGVLLAYGLLLFGLGGVLFRLFAAGEWYLSDMDWTVAKWPALAALAGLACVLEYLASAMAR